MAPHGRKIAITGASGQVGKPTIDALLKHGVHTITALQRSGATSTFPAGVIVKKGNLEDEDWLAEQLKGQDVLVLMPPIPQLIQLQEPAIRAAAKVGLPYIFPSEFGPDPYAGHIVEVNELLINKKHVRDYIEKLGVSSWVSVAVGPWLDGGLAPGLWGIDAKARKATLWKGAEAKINTASINHTGEAIAAALALPEADLAKYKNKAVYTPSLYVNQREILDAVQKATGTTDADWDIQSRDVNEVAKEYEEKIAQGDGFAPFVKFFVTHFLEGSGGDFNHKVDPEEIKKLEALGLGREDIVDVIKSAL
ncbi:putative oxidoreductase CipA-like protein [Mariannaea sp. PMI_226]|nr:putative oxidoreductase CipA-like protein [Mariannaea sp. PMI_226]